MGRTAKTKKTDRKHLTAREVESLIEGATESSRNKERDRGLLRLTYRHGFRVSEVCGLPLDHVDIDGRVLHVKRLKRGLSTTHPLRLDEIRAIKAWLKVRAQMKPPGVVLPIAALIYARASTARLLIAVSMNTAARLADVRYLQGY